MLKALLLIVLIIMMIGALFGFNIGKFLFGSSPRREHYRQNTRKNQSEKTKNTKPSSKIIPKEEGEYVDFEEIKD
jgi:flagellar basal body-associated protein FliL